eukprot:9981600-Alexandrium_andersonii.AAC.1
MIHDKSYPAPAVPKTGRQPQLLLRCAASLSQSPPRPCRWRPAMRWLKPTKGHRSQSGRCGRWGRRRARSRGQGVQHTARGAGRAGGGSCTVRWRRRLGHPR